MLCGTASKRRRREVARIAGVQRRAVPRLVNNVEARTELVLIANAFTKSRRPPKLIVSWSNDFPFVLQIETVEVTVLVVIIDDALRRACRGFELPFASTGKTSRHRVDGGVLLGENSAGANGVLVVELVTRIELDAVGKNVAIDPRGDAVENQIADVIRTKKNRAVAIEDGRLEIEDRPTFF